MFKHQGKHVHIVVLSDSPNSRIFLYFFCFTRECPDADSLVSRFYFGYKQFKWAVFIRK